MERLLQNTLLKNGIALLLVLGAVIHWLIIFGVMYELAPLVLTLYFHSLAIVGIVAGYGLFKSKKYGYYVSLYIAVTQFFSHGYMAYVQYYYLYDSGVSLMERGVEILFSIFLFIYCYYHLFYQRKNYLEK